MKYTDGVELSLVVAFGTIDFSILIGRFLVGWAAEAATEYIINSFHSF